MTGTDDTRDNLDRAIPVANSATGAPDPDLERLLALDAEFFVRVTSANPENPHEWGFPQLDTYRRVSALVPVAAISATGRADENIRRFEGLSARLGADVASPAVEAARLRPHGRRPARGDRRAPDLMVLLVSAADAPFVANPGTWPDLTLFCARGVNAVVPERTDDGHWETLSPEEALTNPADVFQALNGALSVKEVQVHPANGQMPAVKTGQVRTRNLDIDQGHQGLTTSICEPLPPLREAKVVTP